MARKEPAPGQLPIAGLITEATAPAATGSVVGARERALEIELANVSEAFGELERALEDPGWRSLTAELHVAFSRRGLMRLARICRVMAIANPLIRRGIALRVYYVWGQGVEIAARANNDEEGQDVNAVIQEFLDDPLNRAAFTGQQAREEKERTLGTDGQIFLALFTRPLSGRVQVRTLPADEIAEVVRNPEDSTERWFYRREWVSRGLDGSETRRVDYYPDLFYRPTRRVPRIGEYQVHWDAPVRHVAVNTLDGHPWGIPDAYPAVEWARAYKEFLADWARLVKALSRFAWRMTAKGSKQAQAAAAFRRPPSIGGDGQPNSVGATAITGDGMMLEAIPKTGATIDSESGRPIANMVASAMDVPNTMLLGDPGATGARAVAETLDMPTELAMGSRRSLWTAVHTDLFQYVIRESIRAPRGALRGTITRDPETDRESFELTDDTPSTVDITWPDITQTELTQLVAAIVQADQTDKLPPQWVAGALLKALGAENIDELIDEMTDDEGNWIGPDALIAAASKGQQIPPGTLVGDPQDQQDQQDPPAPPGQDENPAPDDGGQ